MNMSPSPQSPPITRWLASFAVYADPRVLSILFLGFASGLPFMLTGGTLFVWLAEAGVTKTAIGLFAIMGTPYTLKFLWAPLMDRVPFPYLTKRLGRRRGWAIVTQIASMAAIIGLGATKPAVHPALTAALAFVVAFCSASQDIVIDAYRVEILQERQYGAGAAVIVLGYRIGMLVSGAGALYLATYAGWPVTYGLMSLLMLAGIATVLLNPEPEVRIRRESAEQEKQKQGKRAQVVAWLYGAVIGPFAEFLNRRGSLIILLFILLYKLGDSLVSIMSNPFYVEMGFTKIEIANITKVFGLTATIVGGIIGGVFVNRIGILKSLFVCGLLQMLSNLMFAVLSAAGRDIRLLAVTIGVEQLSGGMGTAAFVAYLSSLCNVAYTATQYALLTSFMAFGRTVLSSSGGWMADRMDWVSFFVLTTVAAVPGLVVLVLAVYRLPLTVDRHRTPEP